MTSRIGRRSKRGGGALRAVGLRWACLFVVSSASAGCNAILGNEPRELFVEDDLGLDSADEPQDDAGGPLDVLVVDGEQTSSGSGTAVPGASTSAGADAPSVPPDGVGVAAAGPQPPDGGALPTPLATDPSALGLLDAAAAGDAGGDAGPIADASLGDAAPGAPNPALAEAGLADASLAPAEASTKPSDAGRAQSGTRP